MAKRTAFRTVIATFTVEGNKVTQCIDFMSRVQLARIVRRLRAHHGRRGLRIRVKDSAGRWFAVTKDFRLGPLPFDVSRDA